ncbi:hypothetical protein ACIO3R_21405 [Streptomyces sp. NPDC087428]|uniref:hypothetical protein n=1 Tax=Streptomyces sp. NPDC087428 TaxID=3365788 RepID=UPI0037FF8543
MTRAAAATAVAETPPLPVSASCVVVPGGVEVAAAAEDVADEEGVAEAVGVAVPGVAAFSVSDADEPQKVVFLNGVDADRDEVRRASRRPAPAPRRR